MMKKQLLFILFIGIISNSYSQEYTDNVRFGIRAGINFSHLNFSAASLPSENPLETNWQAGVVGGIYMIVPISESFFIQPEYLFSQAGGKVENTNINYRLNYLSLPVFLRWEATNRFSFIAGPQFDLLINAEQENKENSKITSQTESRSVGLAGGLEFGLTNNIGIGIRYFQTVHDIWIPVINNERQEFKHQLIQASVYYMF